MRTYLIHTPSFPRQKYLMEELLDSLVFYRSCHLFTNIRQKKVVRHRWLMPIILSTQKAEIRRIVVQSQPEQRVHKTLSRKYPSQKWLVEWLKVKALSSNPSTTKKKKKKGKTWQLISCTWSDFPMITSGTKEPETIKWLDTLK
jgi:hypothetical protein